MNNTSKKVGYLKGLLENPEIKQDSVNGKLIQGIVDLLGDLSDRLDIIDDLFDDLNHYVESIDDDLTALEGSDADEEAFPFADDEDDDEDFDDFDGGEDQLHLLRPESSADEDEGRAMLCPKCQRALYVLFSDPDSALYVCPHCGESIHPLELIPENLPMAKREE